MTDAALIEIVREGLSLALLLSLPVLVVSLVVGLIFGVVQAATQLQEQTLSFVPRLAAVMITLAALGPWIGAHILSFTSELWQLLGAVHL